MSPAKRRVEKTPFGTKGVKAGFRYPLDDLEDVGSDEIDVR